MKQCKGFNMFPCWICNRENKDETDTLVKSLVFDPDTTTSYCNHWIQFNPEDK